MSQLLRPSPWCIVTTSGGGGSVGDGVAAGGTLFNLYISRNAADDADSPGVIKLSYTGVGCGPAASPLPFSVNFSMTQMPTSKGHIYYRPLSHRKAPEPDDLTGPCVIWVFSGSFGSSGSLTLVFFRTVLFPTISSPVGKVGGFGVSLPGVPSASWMSYWGYLRIGSVNPETLTYNESPEPPDLRQPNFRVVPLALPADVLFDFNRAVLKPGAEPILRNTAQFLAQQRAKSVVIEGHTDSIGTDQFNLVLSVERANAVKNWLVRNNVPNANSFVARGMGKGHPIAPNTRPDGSDDPKGRAQNRRVTFVLTP